MNESKVFTCSSFPALFSNKLNDPVWECFVKGYRKGVTVMILNSKERFQIFFILNSLLNVLESETCDV